MLNDVASHRRGRTLGSGTKRRGSPSVTWVSAMTKRRMRKGKMRMRKRKRMRRKSRWNKVERQHLTS